MRCSCGLEEVQNAPAMPELVDAQAMTFKTTDGLTATIATFTKPWVPRGDGGSKLYIVAFCSSARPQLSISLYNGSDTFRDV